MILGDYAYEIMELLQKNLVDDFYIDIRLVKQLIKDQRKIAISNAINKGGTSPQGNNYGTASGYDGGWENLVTTTRIEMEVVTTDQTSLPCREYPLLWKSVDSFPSVMSMGRRPAVLRVIPLYDSSMPFKSTVVFSSHDRARFVGNGRFNTHQVIGYLRNDSEEVSPATDPVTYVSTNRMWLTSKDDGIGEANFSVIVDAIFSDPTELPDFDEETDDFPIGKLWPYMMQPILEALILKVKAGEDRINDATNSRDDYTTERSRD